MNLYSVGVLILCCLPAFGFAWRGIALLSTKTCNPRRIISVSGVVAMISMWLFAGLTPYVAYHFVQIYNEFDLKSPWITELTVAVLDVPLRLGVFWYPFVLTFGVFALLVPEILFYRPRLK